MAESNKKIVIIGAGPTGLGAATRLTEFNHLNWLILDPYAPGGLSKSFIDEKGFTWDIGGHVIFSHYTYFDDVMDYSTNEWCEHERESWVYCGGQWVPYPFQNNIHRLPNNLKEECLHGLLDVYRQAYDGPPKNFEEYFTRQFGGGIARIFMAPYNFKVWALPPKEMSTEWTGERVATADVKRVISNVIYNKDDAGWGPNAKFRFPLHGGTGGIWSRLAKKLPQDKFLTGDQGEKEASSKVISVDAGIKELTLQSGEKIKYDALISTMPIDDLLRIVTGPFDTTEWPKIADEFQYSSVHIIGFGMKGDAPPPHLKTTCWMYFPEDSSPFYRCTVFSKYSPLNAPKGFWSLMMEVSESKRYKAVDVDKLYEECYKGCIASTLLTEKDEVVSKWHLRMEKGYPTPFLGRNGLLEKVQPVLLKHDIYSRGRFGGWKYEVANQDHSMMQGVEAVDKILGKGEEVTYFQPSVVNSKRNEDRHLALLSVKKEN